MIKLVHNYSVGLDESQCYDESRAEIANYSEVLQKNLEVIANGYNKVNEIYQAALARKKECKIFTWDCHREKLGSQIESYMYKLLCNLNDVKRSVNEVADIATNIEPKIDALFYVFEKNAAVFFDERVYPDCLEEFNAQLEKVNKYGKSVMEAAIDINHCIRLANKVYALADDIDTYCASYIGPDVFKSGFYKYGNDIFRLRRAGKKQKVELNFLAPTSDGSMIYAEAPAALIKKFIFLDPLSPEEVLRLCEKHRFCAVCGRRIQTRESIERGIGPVCSERLSKMDIDTNRKGN